MKCQLCDGKGEYMHAIGGYRPCEHCNGTGKIKVTNEEWFNGLSITEKAKWFCDHITCSDGCPFNKQCLNEDMGRKLWQKWLLEEHDG